MSPESDKSTEAPKSRKEMTMSSQDNLTLAMSDPDGPEVQELMDKYGIEFGDMVELHVEGKDDVMVMTADKNNFWDRDRAASEALAIERNTPQPAETDFTQEAAEHAQSIVGQETPEKNEMLFQRQGAVEDLGVEAVEDVVEEPEVEENPMKSEGESFEDAIARGKSHYERQVDDIFTMAEEDARHKISSIEGDAFEIDAAIGTLDQLIQESADLKKIVMRIEGGDYGVETARRALQNFTEGLYSTYSRLRRASESGVSDVMRQTGTLRDVIEQAASDLQVQEQGFNEFAAEMAQRHSDKDDSAQPEVTTQEARDDFAKTATALDELSGALARKEATIQEKASSILGVIQHLEGIAQDSYSRGVDTVELDSLVNKLRDIAEDAIQLRVTPQIEEQMGAVRQVLSRER